MKTYFLQYKTLSSTIHLAAASKRKFSLHWILIAQFSVSSENKNPEGRRNCRNSNNYPSLPLLSRKMSGSLSLIEQAKKQAAFRAVDEHVKDCQVVGIGSGSTVVYAVERIAQRVRDEGLNLVCIPTSFQAKNLIISNKLRLSELDVHFPIDVTIDGCDECDKELNLIKGGGGCQLQEKIIASASRKLVIIADYTKDSSYLGEKWKKGIPLEVSRIALRVVTNKLNTFGKEVMRTESDVALLRLAKAKMGPVITDTDNFIIDFQIGELFRPGPGNLEPSNVETILKTIPGVLETGLFLGMACQIYFGMEDGTVKTRKLERSPLVY